MYWFLPKALDLRADVGMVLREASAAKCFHSEPTILETIRREMLDSTFVTAFFTVRLRTGP